MSSNNSSNIASLEDSATGLAVRTADYKSYTGQNGVIIKVEKNPETEQVKITKEGITTDEIEIKNTESIDSVIIVSNEDAKKERDSNKRKVTEALLEYAVRSCAKPKAKNDTPEGKEMSQKPAPKEPYFPSGLMTVEVSDKFDINVIFPQNEKPDGIEKYHDGLVLARQARLREVNAWHPGNAAFSLHNGLQTRLR